MIARRFFYSTLKFSWEDKLIDLFISLEALLIPEKSGTKKDKLAARVALLLGDKYSDGEAEGIILQSYELRNNIVHGTPFKTDPIIETLVEDLSDVVKSVLHVYMEKYPGLNSKQLVSQLKLLSHKRGK